MKIFKKLFSFLYITIISLTSGSEINPLHDKTNHIDKKSISTTILNLPRSNEISSEESEYETSNERLSEESEYETSDADENKWLVYDSNKEAFKILLERFPQVPLIQKIDYEKALPSPLMNKLLITTRVNENYLYFVQKSYITDYWLRQCTLLDKWAKELTSLLVHYIDIEENPRLVYNTSNHLVLVQDDARDQKITIDEKRSRNYVIYVNGVRFGRYPKREQNIVLIGNPKYSYHDDFYHDKKYFHISYLTLSHNRAYEYDNGDKNRDKLAYIPLVISKN